MKYFIAGGCGFIGSNFVDYLLQNDKNAHILIYDKITYAGNIDNIPKDKRVLFIQGDICDEQEVDKFAQTCDFMVNFAAETHVDNAIADQTPFLSSNFVGVGVLLDVSRRYNIPLLQVSTDEVYGSIENGLWTEEAPLNPSNPYSASKAAADLLCLAHHETYGTRVIISRCCNNYGPRQHPEKFVPKAILSALKRKDRSIYGNSMPIYGNGLNKRQWIHVSDHCSALHLLIVQRYFLIGQPKYGEIYNIGTPDILSNIKMIVHLESYTSPVYIEYVKDRLGHDWRYALNCDKIITECGWCPKVTLNEGLKTTVEWYIENLKDSHICDLPGKVNHNKERYV